jgi:hypothetical protein
MSNVVGQLVDEGAVILNMIEMGQSIDSAKDIDQYPRSLVTSCLGMYVLLYSVSTYHSRQITVIIIHHIMQWRVMLSMLCV